MGGKTKQSQRTKNNARPSSSGRSAELLGNMTTDFSLLKLSVGNGQSALFPTLTTINLEHGLNPEFQICIKKLNKKDPITKTKALQELCELVNNNKVDDVVAVLPSWAHFYKILTVDTDRKVRESAQACHGAVVGACGRRAAPQLKQLLPAWLQALHDDHAPAQTYALHSLQKTFPEKKLPEVLSFCKVEIMSHLLDSLNGNSDSILTRKLESAEEKEFQQSRVTTSTLRALEYFTQQLPAAQEPWLWAQLAPLLQSTAFWKLHSHKLDQIRAAWYAAMGRFIERFKGTFGEQYGTKTMRVLLGAARETNAVVAANLWACLLQLMHSDQDWHKYLEKKELLVKRILDILESGGWGDARHLSAMLLPLLAHLPPDIFHKQFYQSFFTAIYTGLKQKTIWSSKSERQAWITSLAECLRYLSIQQYDFVVEVVTSVHRTWLQELLCHHRDSLTTANLVKCSAINMASLVKYWIKQSSEHNTDKYDQLIRNFWQNIGSTTSAQIDRMPTNHQEMSQLMELHILLFKTLRSSVSQDLRRTHSIKFEVDKEGVEEKTVEVTPECDKFVCERYKHNLDDLVHIVCLKYFEFAHGQRVCEPIMTPLVGLLMEFDQEKLFLYVAKQFNVDTVYNFYDSVLREWLMDDAMRCKALVDIVFLLLRHMSEEEQECTMDSFEQLPEEVSEWCLCACACASSPLPPRARVWARAERAARTLAALCRRLLSASASAPTSASASASAPASALLLVCRARDATGELLVSPEAVSGGVRLLARSLQGMQDLQDTQDTQAPPAPQPGQQAVAAAAALARAVPALCRDLLLQLFLLTYRVPRGDARLPLETWQEVQSSWQSAISSLDADQRLEFLLELATNIQALLFDNSEGLNTSNIEKITYLCPYLLSKDSSPPEDLQLAIKFTRKLFELDVKTLEPFALHHDCIFSNLNCPFEEYEHLKAVLDDQHRELSRPEVERYLNSLLFRCMYLKVVLLHRADEEEETWCDWLLAEEQMLMDFCRVMHDYAIVCSLCEGYAFWQHYPVLQECKQKLEVLLTEILSESSEASKSLMLKKLSELAASVGYYWSYARRYFQILGKCDADEEETLDLSVLADAVTGNGFFHSLQAKTKNSVDEEAVHRAKFLVMVRSFCLAHGDQLEGVLLRELVGAASAQDLTPIVNAYFRHNDTMLYETDITEAPWKQVVSNAAVLDFLTQLVQSRGWAAPAHCWDFTTITLCSLLSSLEKSKHSWDSVKVGVVWRAVSRLYSAVSGFVSGVQAESMKRRPSDHVAHLPTEWKDIFAPDLHSNLFAIILHVLGSDGSKMNCNRAAALDGLVRCARALRADTCAASASVRAAGVASACAATMRGAAHIAYHYLAHATLALITDALVLEDASKLSQWSERAADEQDEQQEECSRPKLSIEYLEDAYAHLQARAEAEAEAEAEAGADGEAGAEAEEEARCAWLLAAEALHGVCGRARDEVQQQLMQVYRARGFAEPLLSAALRLLPPQLLQHALDNTTPAPPHYEPYFLEAPVTSVYERVREAALVQRLACRAVWWGVATGGGAGARGWAAGATPRGARLLAYLVRGYVSPPLVRRQLTHLQRHADQLEDAEVRIRWSSNEVSCEFPIEERRIELRVCFSRDHPLGLPRALGPSPSGPALNTNWIVLYLAYQNGMLLNALQMWMQAVNARVESAPHCYVCYCRLEAATGRLPRARCHQCNNKFHHSCLRKWFSTSKKSMCPLCRSPF